MSTLIGTGRLSWAPHERRSDRYGTVLLMVDGDSWTEPKAYVDLDQANVGQHGTLAAEVVETRDSTHIGDVFRNMYPETPEVGDVIVLGAGTVFFESTDWGATAVGVRPDDGRTVDWLDPKALYRAHEQTVRLTFAATSGGDDE